MKCALVIEAIADAIAGGGDDATQPGGGDGDGGSGDVGGDCGAVRVNTL